jgi:hypothetical protein
LRANIRPPHCCGAHRSHSSAPDRPRTSNDDAAKIFEDEVTMWGVQFRQTNGSEKVTIGGSFNRMADPRQQPSARVPGLAFEHTPASS